MYKEYFGFKEAPFSIAPDPRYLYMTAQHREALAHLVYGLNSEGGCILLTGEVGTGKTTICRCLLEQIPDQSNVALVLNPKVSEIELLETICDELNINYPSNSNSVKTYTDRIYDFLLSSNRKNEKTVLIIDEAQNLSSEVLEQLRLLTNLETNQRKLLQIIILGQPELLDILTRTEMRQLAQRITARFHLQPLTRHEVKAYISHRLAVAGQNIQLFPEPSIKLLYRLSNGVPRLLNIICDRALLGAYVENQHAVYPATIKKAANEVFGELKNVEQHKKNKQWLYPLIALSSLTGIAFVIIFYVISSQNKPDSSLVLPQTGIIDKVQPKKVTDIKNQKSSSSPLNLTVINKNTSPGVTGATPTLNEITPTNSANKQKEKNSTNLQYDDIETILNTQFNDRSSAYSQLFKTWGQHYDRKSITNACKQASAYSLSCLYKQGNLNSLKVHNRPAVLTLINKQGEKRHVTITSINNEAATIYANDSAYTVNLNQLDQYWYGRFVLLWQKPEHYQSAITPGDKGAIINWLRARLEKINNHPFEKKLAIYNKKLADQVVSFQSQQGLTADGIVGPVTIIHLNTQAGMEVPTLAPSSSFQLTKQG